MARRIKTAKRKQYGNRTFGGGNKKNRRGKGVRGGVGRAGYHKHKWLHTIKFEGTTQTAPGFVNPTRKKIAAFQLNKLAREIAKGRHKEENGAYNIDLTRKGRQVKVLGNGEFPYKANIKANSFSKGAKERIEKAQGTALSSQ
ncbi:MAG: uL15m family ribosomal protein [Candidatus Micrarchaeota archaeon]